MTKQERIEEMATVISNYADKHEWELHEPELEDLAIELYNAGYRKVDEVCKETAKEFAEKLKIEAIRLPAIENYHVCNLIDKLLKEYEK